MTPYFIITSDTVEVRDGIVESLCEKTGMKRTPIQTTNIELARNSVKFNLNQWQQSYKVKPNNMVLVVQDNDDLYGVKMYDINANDVIAIGPEDAKTIKTYCIGANRSCYVIAVGHKLDMKPEYKIVSDFHTDEPDENAILAYIISKMIEQH